MENSNPRHVNVVFDKVKGVTGGECIFICIVWRKTEKQCLVLTRSIASRLAQGQSSALLILAQAVA